MSKDGYQELKKFIYNEIKEFNSKVGEVINYKGIISNANKVSYTHESLLKVFDELKENNFLDRDAKLTEKGYQEIYDITEDKKLSEAISFIYNFVKKSNMKIGDKLNGGAIYHSALKHKPHISENLLKALDVLKKEELISNDDLLTEKGYKKIIL